MQTDPRTPVSNMNNGQHGEEVSEDYDALSLEEQLTEYIVHNVTQCFNSVNISKIDGVTKVGGNVNVALGRSNNSPPVHDSIVLDASLAAYVPIVDNYATDDFMQLNDNDVVVVRPFAGRRVVMWVGRKDGNAVYFSDVRAMVKQGGVRENDVMKVENMDTRFKYLNTNLHAGRGARYIHFPICHLGHWSLVVYNTEDGSWKYYNSMRNRSGTGGVHYAKAVKLKSIVTDVQRQSMAAHGLEQMVRTQEFDMTMESIIECPQQCLDIMDCEIIVCAIMRQYMHHVEMGRYLE
ncbi:hypothetical protein LOK49_LG12G02688 [Camellia lanceoleosa]|uniref:Uncharacterized protein n=1 Tax=Camellia lanceoleosa TaxID=1840588 RepID=A0ACC0FXI0_9ERIC|nr:hypothetical protein LOK49_LG12G02688 [Camellia lanceoleosa]